MLEDSLQSTWPDDSEFVILRKSDWEQLRRLITSLPFLNNSPLNDIVLIPCVLDREEEW